MRASGVRSGRRRRFSADERRRLVEAWRKSGLSQGEFARRHGIYAAYLSRWKVELAVEQTPELVAVRVVDDAPRPGQGGAFELRLRSGIDVAVPAGFDAAEPMRLLATLARVPC